METRHTVSWEKQREEPERCRLEAASPSLPAAPGTSIPQPLHADITAPPPGPS